MAASRTGGTVPAAGFPHQRFFPLLGTESGRGCVPERKVKPMNASRTALVVVDVQRGFDDASFWGPRNNPDCERNVERLIEAWRDHGQPLVFVRHDSIEETSPLRSGAPGNGFKDAVRGEPDLLVTKQVNSAFHGTPDLDRWLRQSGVDGIVVCGIQTNMCCETTARVGANLGFELGFAIDATHTFDLADGDGGTIAADELARVTAANLDPEFGRVLTTREAIAELGATS
jgi:nicotinamidase-related amidase